jgi:hypothetical protein
MADEQGARFAQPMFGEAQFASAEVEAVVEIGYRAGGVRKVAGPSYG